jgi:alkylation response protein AidB-like acyl-CoA dehydrogenase
MERLSIGARCTGACQSVINEAVAYASQRQQFGQLIGKFQAIQHIIADMEIATQAIRALTYRLAWMIDNGMPCAREAAVVKVFGSESYARVASLGVQVFGGYGYTMEFPMQRHYRDAKIFEIGGGTSQIQRSIIAKGLGL